MSILWTPGAPADQAIITLAEPGGFAVEEAEIAAGGQLLSIREAVGNALTVSLLMPLCTKRYRKLPRSARSHQSRASNKAERRKQTHKRVRD